MSLLQGNRSLYAAMGLFGSFWLFLSQSLPVWHENVAVYPARASAVLARVSDVDPGPRFAASCADPGPLRVVVDDVRPNVALCVHGRQYPLQIMSYASGLPYWVSDLLRPLHGGQVFGVRAMGLGLAFLNLLLARRLLRRFADTTTADVALLFLAVTPPFLVIQSLLAHFEVLPWIACAAAIDQLARCRSLDPASVSCTEPPPTGRIVLAAAFVGLSLLANLKSVFLLAPIAVIALRAGVSWRALRPHQWVYSALIVLLVLSPSLAGQLVDEGAGLSHQFRERWQFVVAQLAPSFVAAELPNLARFWGDTLVFMTIASGENLPASLPGPLATVLPLGYCLTAAVIFLVRGRGPIVPATCGLLMLVFIHVSAFLYIGVPKGNYGPLYAVCGIATAATVVDVSRWIARRLGWRPDAVLVTLVVVAMSSFAWSVLERGNPTRFIGMAINANAVKEMGEYLRIAPDRDLPLFATTFNLTGVPEAVTGGTVRSIVTYNYLEGCPPGRNMGVEPTPAILEGGRACIRERLVELVRAFPGPIRFLYPLTFAPVDDYLAAEYGELLAAVADQEGRTFRDEATFSGTGTVPLLRLARIDGARTVPSGSHPSDEAPTRDAP